MSTTTFQPACITSVAKCACAAEREIVVARHEPADRRLQVRRLLGQRDRVVIQVDKDQIAELLDTHGLQTEVALVETLNMLAVARGPQAAVRCIGPGVIGAGNDRLHVAGALQQLVGAMLADVIEGAKFAVAAANDEDTLIDNGRRHVVAGIGDLALVADILPGAEKDPLLLQLEDLGVGVIARRQGIGTRRVLGQRLGERLRVRH